MTQKEIAKALKDNAGLRFQGSARRIRADLARIAQFRA